MPKPPKDPPNTRRDTFGNLLYRCQGYVSGQYRDILEELMQDKSIRQSKAMEFLLEYYDSTRKSGREFESTPDPPQPRHFKRA